MVIQATYNIVAKSDVVWLIWTIFSLLPTQLITITKVQGTTITVHNTVKIWYVFTVQNSIGKKANYRINIKELISNKAYSTFAAILSDINILRILFCTTVILYSHSHCVFGLYAKPP